MAGKWKPAPTEVLTKLKKCHDSCYRVYFSLLDDFRVQEDFRIPGEWVIGRVRATKQQIIERSEVGKNTFYRKAWPQLKEAGLVEEEDGDSIISSIRIPYIWRKLDVPPEKAQMSEMEQAQEDADRRMEKMERRVRNMEQRLEAETFDNPSAESGQLTQGTGKLTQRTGCEPVLHPFKEESKVSLSTLNTVISGFYRGIGQNRISKEKRERAFKIATKLRKDGFSLEDIAFAVEWTLENAKEDPYDFGIIQHTIGQALAARDKHESEKSAIEEREKAAEEERSKREGEKGEREEIETQKAGLSEEKRAELREGAEAEILDSGIYKPGFISEPLIAAKENEILRKQLTQKMGPPDDAESGEEPD